MSGTVLLGTGYVLKYVVMLWGSIESERGREAREAPQNERSLSLYELGYMYFEQSESAWRVGEGRRLAMFGGHLLFLSIDPNKRS